ncbi:MAG: twin-arginine translocase subunit TatC, partial [Eubacteriales bacterium]|nr:twin-arginine translocase subunit TatC [Eubacteriales bacterium]
MPKEKDMPLSGHLRELRNRIAVCVICLVVVFLGALYLAPGIINFLTDMGNQYDYVFVYLSPQELLMQHLAVALTASICVTLPMTIYQ